MSYCFSLGKVGVESVPKERSDDAEMTFGSRDGQNATVLERTNSLAVRLNRTNVIREDIVTRAAK
jgi:hypothetical protein